MYYINRNLQEEKNMKINRLTPFLIIAAILILTIFIHLSIQQMIEVIDVTQGNGFALIRQDEIKIIKNYKKILHLINLTQYDENIKIIKNNVNRLKIVTNIPETLMYNLIHLENDFNSIIPHHIHKRGLFNLYGTFLKIIGGTMDADDEEEIKNHFSIVDKNNHNVIKNMNAQIVINQNISNKIQEITNHINKQQKLIEIKINKFGNSINVIEKRLREHIIISEINENIQILYNQIKNIKENIMLSRLEVIGKDILSDKEIIENEIDIAKLPYIKSSVLLKENTIIFVLLIPTFTNDSFYKNVIEPIPNFGINLEIQINNKIVITNQNNVYYNIESEPIMFKNLKKYDDDCIPNLFEPKLLNCSYRKNIQTSVNQITSNIIVTKNLKPTLAIHNCNDQYKLTLRGNIIIKIENCKIKINNQEFTNKINKYFESFILPNLKKNITIADITNNFSLNEIHVNGINNLKEITELKYEHTNTIWRSLSCDIVILCIIIAITIFAYVKLKNNCQRASFNVEINSAPHNSRQESIPMEGDVTSQSATSPFS